MKTDAISQRWKESGPGWSHRLRGSRRSGPSTTWRGSNGAGPELSWVPSKTSVPEIHVPGYRDVAEIGKRLAGAEGLNDGQRRMIANWQKADRLQGELTARIESLPNEAATLVERTRASSAEASGNADNVPDAAWKNQCETLADECRAMLDPDSDHAPHLDAIAGARDRISEAGSFLETALLEMDIASFHGLARAVKNWVEETGGLELDAPDYPELRRQARHTCRTQRGARKGPGSDQGMDGCQCAGMSWSACGSARSSRGLAH